MLHSTSYPSSGGLTIVRTAATLDFPIDLKAIATTIDLERGLLLSSSYEVAGRYKRWSVAVTNPMLALTVRGAAFEIAALNPRGAALLPLLAKGIAALARLESFSHNQRSISGTISADPDMKDESERGKRPSVFSVLRVLQQFFYSDQDSNLGLYGSFGYDLVFQFDPMPLSKTRPADQRDLVLFLPDEITLIDNRKETATRLSYDFQWRDTQGENQSTARLARQPFAANSAVATTRSAPAPASAPASVSTPAEPVELVEADLPKGGYAAIVREAFAKFKCGDLFEVVPSHRFYAKSLATPSQLFAILSEINPSPYGFLMNLGEGEFLIGASPEMFVRVQGKRVETCPISGTIKRGRDALEDAEQIRTLLNSQKDETELTMCTDVDRNDKARVCKPGTVRVIGRRQLELYSHLIHTVDHVEGELAEGFDALDAFLSHMWAVTVTGAPKRAAIAFIEAVEPGTRRWYGGAIGRLGFDGNMETGLTLRTMRYSTVLDSASNSAGDSHESHATGATRGASGIVEIRAGATLLADSDPEAEEAETILKAAALQATIARANRSNSQSLTNSTAANAATNAKVAAINASDTSAMRKKILVMDCEDSFVHNLALYLRLAGGDTVVLRGNAAFAAVEKDSFDLVVLSPGPGRPEQFRVPEMVRLLIQKRLPIFGVCLGLQGIVEALGGKLATLEVPKHGRSSRIVLAADGQNSRLFQGIDSGFSVGRYHSLYADETTLPPALKITAMSEDGIIMAVEHTELPITAVQFHPESIMSGTNEVGQKIINNVLRFL